MLKCVLTTRDKQLNVKVFFLKKFAFNFLQVKFLYFLIQ
jgi:hypothetical protein